MEFRELYRMYISRINGEHRVKYIKKRLYISPRKKQK